MVAKPRITVRLMYRDHASVRRLTRGLQDSSNLYRMVAIVVDDRHTIDFAHFRKPSVNASEPLERGLDLIKFHAQMPRNCHRRQRVRDIVIPRHRQFATVNHDPFGLKGDIEMCHASLIHQVNGPHVRLRVKAKCHHTAITDLADQRLHIWIIGAAHSQSIERNIGYEIEEALMKRLFCFPMLHVLRVNIGHNRNGRWQPVKGTVALIGFDHHPFALPHPRVGAIGMNDPAVDHSWVNPTFVKKGCNHGRGCGLTMRPRDGDV